MDNGRVVGGTPFRGNARGPSGWLERVGVSARAARRPQSPGRSSDAQAGPQRVDGPTSSETVSGWDGQRGPPRPAVASSPSGWRSTRRASRPVPQRRGVPSSRGHAAWFSPRGTKPSPVHSFRLRDLQFMCSLHSEGRPWGRCPPPSETRCHKRTGLGGTESLQVIPAALGVSVPALCHPSLSSCLGQRYM